MDKLERIFLLHRILSARRTPVARQDLQDRLDCKRATLTRIITFSRDYFGSPIVFDRERQGYYLDSRDGKAFELPGLWFSPTEVHALLTSHHLLSNIKPGLLAPHIVPLIERLEGLLRHKRAGSKEALQRLRLLPLAQREARLEDFQKVADALVGRKRVRVQYQSRGKDEMSERWLSPQRLIYYRDNWYLYAWCHLRESIRTFSIDRL